MKRCFFWLSALALVLCTSALGQEVITFSDGSKCGMEGTAKRDNVKAVNGLKNRYTPPTDADIDPDVTLAAMLAPGDDIDRFDWSKAATITGFVIDVKPGGNETCNCGAGAQIDRDTHIELALSEDAPETQRVVVEITPRFRQQMSANGIDWSTPEIRRGIKGKWVEVTGWLLFDIMHVHEAENTNPGNDRNWRATCWEIHPISRIRLLKEPIGDPPLISSTAMSAFHRTTARQLKREPKRRELIEERNRLVLSQFDKTDIEEVWPAETAEPRMFHFDKAAAAEARIGLEIPGNAGIGLATCYRKRGTACLSGYLKGLDSACANRCNIADTLERAVKANAAFNLK